MTLLSEKPLPIPAEYEGHPVPFYDIHIQLGRPLRASVESLRLLPRRAGSIEFLSPGSLYQHPDDPSKFVYKFTDGHWFEFEEKGNE